MDRWDGFFDDLEGRVEEQRRADELAGLADRVRRDRAGITLAARLAGVARSGGRVHVLGGEQVSGQVDEVMVDCVVLEDGGRRAVVPLASVVRVDRLGDRPGPLSLGDRPGLGRAVRDLARDRRPVRAHDVTGVVNEGVLDRARGGGALADDRALQRPRGGASALSAGVGVDRAEGMGRDESLGLGVHPLDVVLELAGLHPPLSSSADLDGRELARAHQRIGLRGGDVEDLGDLGELDETLGHGVLLLMRRLSGRWATSVPGEDESRAGGPFVRSPSGEGVDNSAACG